MRGIVIAGLLGACCALCIGWVIVKGVPWKRSADTASPAPSASPPPQAGAADAARRIRANLFYVSEDGLRLQATEREVPYSEDISAQARLLLEEQLKPAPPPLAQAIAPGTSVRALFLTPRGDAFVDLTREATASHTGGSLDELFAVYAIVNVLTVNLPAISRVQILVDGQEVDTLAGHIDLRTPLQKSMKWVAAPEAPPRAAAAVP